MNAAHSSGIDWEDARQRIARLGDTLAQGETFTPEETEAILYARARRLAEVVEPPQDSSERIEVMLIDLAEERYAVETMVIREVLRPAKMALLPGAASHIAGVMNLRGRPLLLVDGRALLGLTCSELTAAARVVVMGVGQPEFGLLTEATEEVAELDASEIREPPKSLPGTARRFVRGVTSDATIVLDTESLMNDPSLWIDEQIE